MRYRYKILTDLSPFVERVRAVMGDVNRELAACDVGPITCLGELAAGEVDVDHALTESELSAIARELEGEAKAVFPRAAVIVQIERVKGEEGREKAEVPTSQF